MRGFIATVLRPAEGGDCTAGGPSSRFARCLIVDMRVPALFELDETREFAVIIRSKMIGGEEYLYAEPLVPAGETRQHRMMGGNFIYSCDSRFREAFGNRPLPLHDRIER